MKHAGKEPFPVIYVDSKEENKVCLLKSRLIIDGQ